MASCSPFESDEDDVIETESRYNISAVVDIYDPVEEANYDLDQKYRAEETILLKKLHQVQTELKNSKELRRLADLDKSDTFRYYSVGKPYFKDKNLNNPPDNEDTLIMKQYQMYDFSNVMAVSGWTVGDKNKLLKVLLTMSKDIIKKKLQKELSDLHRLKFKTEANNCRINYIKKELMGINNKKLEDLDLSTFEEFDWEEIALKLDKRHSPREYKAIWELFFHPRVNKSAWGHKEHQDLQKIAAAHNMQDWEAIAKELNTGRTGYQCFVYFRTNVNHAACGRKWTQKEISFLRKVIDLYKEDSYIPWGKVAASMQNRTKIQCYNKHMRMIEERKGRFIPEEDAVILNFINAYGKDFRKMSTFFTGRSAIQLRVRYKLLRKMHVSTTWTVDDDRKLLQIMANQDSRTNFSTATKHFPGKDRQNIRSRYNILIRWMKGHPHSDISTAPRRASRRLPRGAPCADLARALLALRARLQGERGERGERAGAAGRPPRRLTRAAPAAAMRAALASLVANAEARRELAAAALPEPPPARAPRASGTAPENALALRCALLALNATLAPRFRESERELAAALDRAATRAEAERSARVRSYSRAAPSAPEPLARPTLYGEIAGRRRFLAAPCLATITGSRVILALLSGMLSKERGEVSVKTIARRNRMLNEALTRFRERFIDLFTWPYILSNEPPEYYALHASELLEKRARAVPRERRGRSLPSAPAVTIPPARRRRGRGRGPRARGEDARIDADEMRVEETTFLDKDIERNFNLESDPFEESSEG